MLKSRLDILNLEWSSNPSRDRAMATLVSNYARYQGFKVFEGCIFNGYKLIDRYNPKVLFLTNSLGAKINLNILKYAMSKGITCFTLISEGNFKEDPKSIKQFTWGWNKEQILYEHVHCHWTERTRKLSYSQFPKLKGRIKVSGGVGFDQYIISRNASFSLEKYKKSYDKVIGIGCWTFGRFYPEDGRFESVLKRLGTKKVERFRNDRNQFNKILKNIVKQNDDVLFLIKKHPGNSLGNFGAGIDGLEEEENVLILKNEEGIMDCIVHSDLWLVYESTTALEAWLLDKPTGLINPSGTDFKRDEVSQGSPNYPNEVILQKTIDAYYQSGNLPHFEALQTKRDELIRKTIQWNDGLNHVRAGNELIDLLEGKLHKSIHPNKGEVLRSKLQWKLVSLLSNFTKNYGDIKQRIKSFDSDKLKEYASLKLKEQIAFYNSIGIEKDELRKVRGLD